MDDAIRETYLENMNELLSSLEEISLALEEELDNKKYIDEIFRIVHTIKGTSAMFGQSRVSELVHDGENILSLMRDEEIAVDKEVIDMLLRTKDVISRLLYDDVNISPGDEKEVEDIKEWFKTRLNEEKEEEEKEETDRQEPIKENPPLPGNKENVFRIMLKPQDDILFSGVKLFPIMKELMEMGELATAAFRDKIPSLDEIDPERFYTYWDFYLKTAFTINQLKDVFIFIEDKAEIRIDSLDLEMSIEGTQLGKILLERNFITPEILEEGLEEQKKIGEILVRKGKVNDSQVEGALYEQKYIKNLKEEVQAKKAISSIKVKSDKLDKMINLVGELVTLQARFKETCAGKDDGELFRLSEDFDRIGAELRTTTMNIRMLPIGILFNRFKRLIRDLSDQLGKEVEFSISGAGTELDKNVIERLHDPLIHLIRNTLDHGIEFPSEREKAGKERKGSLHLSAAHLGADVVIRISDDGAGLDREKILYRARSRGLYSREEELSDADVYDLIFKPGFSTSKNITDLSGRGVGLNVVKNAIEVLSGSVEIESKPGAGTEFVLRIPLTLAIIDGLLLQVDEDLYVLPLMFVDRCIELQEGRGSSHHNMETIDGVLVPFINFRKIFDINTPEPPLTNAVILNINDTRAGLVVDRVAGKHQTVIKSLGKVYREAEGFSGATVLGDGTIALILDAPKIIQIAELEKKKHKRNIEEAKYAGS